MQFNFMVSINVALIVFVNTVFHQIEARASIVSRRGFDGPLFRGGGAFNTNNQLAGTFNSGAFNSNKTFDRNLK